MYLTEKSRSSRLKKFLIKHSTTAIGRSRNLYKGNSTRPMALPILVLSFLISCCINTAFANNPKEIVASEDSPQVEVSTELVTTEVLSKEALSFPVAGASLEMSNLQRDFFQESQSEIENSQVEPVEVSIEVEPEKIEYSKEDFDFSKTGYVSTKLRVREEPNTDSEILDMLYYNEEVSYSDFNDEWAAIEYGDGIAFISSNYINDEKAVFDAKSVSGDQRKSYMDYTAITKLSSPQYKLQQQAYTASNGVRAVNGRYCIALGSYYSHNVGQYVDLVLENGTVIECIVGDCKADCDTINNHSLGVDGGATEFIVQTSALNSTARGWGDCSYCEDSWNSNVIEIRLYDVDLL